MTKTSARDAALDSLLRCEKSKKYSNLELSAAIKKYGLEGAEKSLYTRLVYGVVERRITLDNAISVYSDIPPERIDADTAMILRIALYQYYYLERIPENAIVNEAVESAKRRRRSAAGFVNAVLRSAVRGGKNIPLPPEGTVDYESTRYSIPVWMISLFRDQYEDKTCTDILEGFDRIPYTALTVNTLKTSRGSLAAELEDRGCEIEIPDLPERAVYIKNGLPEAARKYLENGMFFIQDTASQTALQALDPKPGETLIDVCACPGGKSFYAALCMENRGRIISRDLHENKLSLVRSGADRLGIDIIETEAANAAIPDPAYAGIADKVVCDVPCSGLGVIAKKPDLRYKDPGDIEKLPDIQSGILSTCAGYLKKGGRLLYSTCTLNKEENESIIERFLSENPGFILFEKRTLIPGIRNDGFFYAVVGRK